MNTTLAVPCQQGSVPIGGVDVRSVSDIQAAVRFTVKYNLHPAVKNTEWLIPLAVIKLDLILPRVADMTILAEAQFKVHL